jgi:hypothetical protein
MSLLPLGAAGWVETRPDGTFGFQLRGRVSEHDARRLAEWLQEQTSHGGDDATRPPAG